MKVQIRQSVFETNSSTCHTIAIPKRPTEDIEEGLTIWNIQQDWGENYCYGRGLLRLVESVGDKIAFSYMLLLYQFGHQMSSKKYGGQGKTFKEVEPEIDKWKNFILKWVDETSDPEKKDEVVGYVSRMLEFLKNAILLEDKPSEEFGKTAWIEHPEELMGFVEAVNRDPELLRKFIFDSEAYASVCGDEYKGGYIKRLGFDYDWEEPGFDGKLDELKKDWHIWRSEDL